MNVLIVLENPKNWTLELAGARVVAARDYLINPEFAAMRRAKVFNLCRSYSYQTVGYYVSLLAAARGHTPLPGLATLQDLRQGPLLRLAGEDLEEVIQRSLGKVRSDTFVLSIYFGRNMAKQHARLAGALFDLFPSPMLRAEFKREQTWRLVSLRPVGAADIPDSHRSFVEEQAGRYFRRPRAAGAGRRNLRYDLAILANPEEDDPPSDERALKRFVKAARDLGMDACLIDRSDYSRLAEYDALFIRETTYVNHHTFRFSRRAEAEGLVVVDDPESILRCTNKVYLAEMFQRNGIPCPRTEIVHANTVAGLEERMGLPCVVKKPDSAFSKGVSKAETPKELIRLLDEVFTASDLAVVQEFIPSTFDWRIGVLDGQPLYACRYYMAKGDWRIQAVGEAGKMLYGRAETLPVADAPRGVVDLAVRSCAAIGNGLYGVDIKESDGAFYVMEVNDNPSLDAGVEDEVLGEELYAAIMRMFLERLERRGRSS